MAAIDRSVTDFAAKTGSRRVQPAQSGRLAHGFYGIEKPPSTELQVQRAIMRSMPRCQWRLKHIPSCERPYTGGTP